MLQYHFNWKTLSAMAGVTWWNFYFRLFPGTIRSPQVVDQGEVMAKMPVPMTIGGMFKELTRVLQEAPEEDRQEFKKAWLNSVHRFDAETDWMRQERSRNSR